MDSPLDSRKYQTNPLLILMQEAFDEKMSNYEFALQRYSLKVLQAYQKRWFDLL